MREEANPRWDLNPRPLTLHADALQIELRGTAVNSLRFSLRTKQPHCYIGAAWMRNWVKKQTQHVIWYSALLLYQ